ncbi:MAG TPA: hypothetical protein VID71_06740 [Steroidobacteraceae bacterium]
MNYRSAGIQVFAAMADILKIRLFRPRDGEALAGCDAVRSAGAADPVPENMHEPLDP